MAMLPPIGGPGPGLIIAQQDSLMTYASSTAGTKGDIVSVVLPTAVGGSDGITKGGHYTEVAPPVDAANDEVSETDTGFLGVLLEDCVEGDTVRVRFSGYVLAKAGGVIEPGDMCSVENDTTGKLIPGATGDKVVASYPGIGPLGTFVDTADGDLVYVYFNGITTFGEA